jgi:hypothetical protein
MTTIHCAGCGQALTRSLELSEHIRSDDMALSTYYIDPSLGWKSAKSSGYSTLPVQSWCIPNTAS